MSKPNEWYVKEMTAHEFFLAMLYLGKPLDVSLVGAFEDKEAQTVRGSRRDIELPLHRDGEYSADLAAVQGGTYVERAGIAYVGLYCLRAGDEPCYTTIQDSGGTTTDVNLQPGSALIFNNRRVLHGRKGLVGKRVLIRMWVGDK